jgi:hypothetical protein
MVLEGVTDKMFVTQKKFDYETQRLKDYIGEISARNLRLREWAQDLFSKQIEMTQKLTDTLKETLTEVAYLKGKLDTLMNSAQSQRNAYNNDTNEGNPHEKLRQIQRQMDSQVGQVTDNVVELPNDVREYLETHGS